MSLSARNRYVLNTKLSPQACQERLEVRTRSWFGPHTWAARRTDRPMTGRVSSDGFSLCRYGGLPAYAFKPRAIGTFHQAADGTRVDLRLPTRLLPMVLLCTGSWGGYFALMLAGYRYIIHPVVHAVMTREPLLFLLYSVVGPLVSIALWSYISLRRARQERAFLFDFLRATLEAEAKYGQAA